MKLDEGPRLMVIKTLVNSWATTRRYHEDIQLPCLFCALEFGDSLPHYLACDTLWTLLVSAASLRTSFLGAPPLTRACFSAPSVVGCSLLAGAFLVYHAIRRQHLDEALAAIAAGDLSPTHCLVLELAKFHYASIDVFQHEHERG